MLGACSATIVGLLVVGLLPSSRFLIGVLVFAVAFVGAFLDVGPVTLKIGLGISSVNLLLYAVTPDLPLSFPPNVLVDLAAGCVCGLCAAVLPFPRLASRQASSRLLLGSRLLQRYLPRLRHALLAPSQDEMTWHRGSLLQIGSALTAAEAQLTQRLAELDYEPHRAHTARRLRASASLLSYLSSCLSAVTEQLQKLQLSPAHEHFRELLAESLTSLTEEMADALSHVGADLSATAEAGAQSRQQATERACLRLLQRYGVFRARVLGYGTLDASGGSGGSPVARSGRSSGGSGSGSGSGSGDGNGDVKSVVAASHAEPVVQTGTLSEAEVESKAEAEADIDEAEAETKAEAEAEAEAGAEAGAEPACVVLSVTDAAAAAETKQPTDTDAVTEPEAEVGAEAEIGHLYGSALNLSLADNALMSVHELEVYHSIVFHLAHCSRALFWFHHAKAFDGGGNNTSCSALRAAFTACRTSLPAFPHWPARSRAALKLSLALTIASLLQLLPALNARFPLALWAPITISFVAGGRVGSSLQQSVLRLNGSVMGAMAGYLYSILAMDSPVAIACGVTLWVTAAAYVRSNPAIGYAGVVAAFTMPLIILGHDPRHGEVKQYALGRIEQTTIGLLILLTIMVALWPVRGSSLLRASVIKHMAHSKRYLYSLLQCHHSMASEDRPPEHSRFSTFRARVARRSKAAATARLHLSLLAEARREPVFCAPPFPVAAFGRIIAAQCAISSALSVMDSVLAALKANDGPYVLVAHTSAALIRLEQQIGSALDALGASLADCGDEQSSHTIAAAAEEEQQPLRHFPTLLLIRHAASEFESDLLQRLRRARAVHGAPSTVDAVAHLTLTAACHDMVAALTQLAQAVLDAVQGQRTSQQLLQLL